MNKNSFLKVAVAGASGYAGGELLRYLLSHKMVNLGSVLGHSQAGSSVSQLFPNLLGFCDKTVEAADWSKLAKEHDLVFLALPHGQSQAPVEALLEGGCRVIDLGADFRLSSPELYQSTYGSPHSCPSYLQQAVYGLPELYRKAIKESRLVANPGCYPTASLLSLLPVRGAKLTVPPVIDAKSGASGAGRGVKQSSLFCEVNENFKAYGVGTHRHKPEIEDKFGGPVLFTPHLVPMNRGILATVYVNLPVEGLLERYQEFYEPEPFVQVLTEELPNTRSVSGTNFCHLAVRSSGQPDYSIVVTVIDNLGKGAAGSAVHNMNLMFGLEETEGLKAPALF